MAGIIEVYIMNQEVVTQMSLEGRPLAAGSTVHYCTVKELAKTKTGKIFSEEDETALRLVREFAAENGFEVRVVDTASFKGKIKAMLKRVKATPTIIFGGARVIGVPKKEELEAMLSHK